MDVVDLDGRQSPGQVRPGGDCGRRPAIGQAMVSRFLVDQRDLARLGVVKRGGPVDHEATVTDQHSVDQRRKLCERGLHGFGFLSEGGSSADALLEGKRGQSPFAATARRVLRTTGDCRLLPGDSEGTAIYRNPPSRARSVAQDTPPPGCVSRFAFGENMDLSLPSRPMNGYSPGNPGGCTAPRRQLGLDATAGSLRPVHGPFRRRRYSARHSCRVREARTDRFRCNLHGLRPVHGPSRGEGFSPARFPLG